MTPIEKLIMKTMANVARRNTTDSLRRHPSKQQWTTQGQAAIPAYIKCLARTGEATPKSLPGVNVNDLTNENRRFIRSCFASAYLDLRDELPNLGDLAFGKQDWFLEDLPRECHYRETVAAARARRAPSGKPRRPRIWDTVNTTS